MTVTVSTTYEIGASTAMVVWKLTLQNAVTVTDAQCECTMTPHKTCPDNKVKHEVLIMQHNVRYSFSTVQI